MPESITYQEIQPPPELARQVVCAWWLKGVAGPEHVDTVYPDGCCEVIVHLATPPRVWLDSGRWSQQSISLFAAQRRTALQLSWSGEVDCFGLRLQPAASAIIPRESLIDLKDQVADLKSLDAEFADGLIEQVKENAAPFVAAPIWDFVARRLSDAALDSLVEQAVESIHSSHGACQIESLATRAKLGMRAFQIRFNRSVGLSPKEFARIVRLQTTLRLLDTGEATLAELALDGGFSDQAHANREVRRMTGLTPARLRNALNSDRESGDTIRMAAAFVRGHGLTGYYHG